MTQHIKVSKNGFTGILCLDKRTNYITMLNINSQMDWGVKLLADIRRETMHKEHTCMCCPPYKSDYKLWIEIKATDYLPSMNYPLSPNQVMWKLFDFKCCGDVPAEYIDKDGNNFCINCLS